MEGIADEDTSPVSTAEFISFIGSTLRERTRAFKSELERNRTATDDDLQAYDSKINAYAREIESISEAMQPVTVIATTAGSEYARFIRDAVEMKRSHTDELPEPACDELDAIGDLLRSLSISRQYYKTIALQQDFAQLSRLLVFASLPAALVAIYAPLLYQSGPDTLIALQY